MNIIDIVLSTRNPSKIAQIRPFFDGLPVKILTLDDVGVEGEAVEDGSTLVQNALKKARFASERSGKLSVADDTGLYIDALQGEPGMRAARWAGKNATTEEIMQFTLKKLEGVPAQDRGAVFQTVAVVVAPNCPLVWIFRGEVRGILLTAPRVPCQPGMPYSALFVADGQSKVWAEMSTKEENRLSHRGKAFQKLRALFIE